MDDRATPASHRNDLRRRSTLRFLLAGGALLVACLLAGCGSTNVDPLSTLNTSHGRVVVDGAHLRDESLRAGGRTRSYLLYVPPGSSQSHPLPLVLVYHGADSTALSTIGPSDLLSFDERHHSMILAFLQGYDETWNDDAGNPPAEAAHVNDIAFTTAALREIETSDSVNRAQVVATGLSNGAIFAELLGCRIASDLTLIVPVEGQIANRFSANCAPSAPISVFEIHATADPAIPYKGGTFQGVGGPVTVLSAPASVARWAALDHCTQNAGQSRAGGFEVTSYGGCGDGASVKLATIEGGKHAWPPGFGETLAAAIASTGSGRQAATP